MDNSGYYDLENSFHSCSSSTEFLSLSSGSNSIESLPLDKRLNDIFTNSLPSLNLVHINAQSIPAHYSDLITTFEGVSVDCILVSESWLKPSLPSTLYPLQDFILIRNDRRDGRGGGVCIYVRKGISCKIVSQSPNTNRGQLEYLLLEIVVSHSKVLLGVLYSPSSAVNYFEGLEELISCYYPYYEHVIFMGDFNTCLLKNDHRALKLQNLIGSFNMHILPLSPTHFSVNSDPSLIDLMLISQPSKVVSYGQLTAPFSYHDLLYMSYKLRRPKNRAKTVMQRSISGIDINSLRQDFSLVDWIPLYEASSVDSKVDILNSTITRIFDRHAPLRPIRVKRLPAPWITSELKNLMSKRNKAKTKCKRSPTESNIKIYKNLRNTCNRMCRDAKRSYIFKSAENLSQAQLWKFLGRLGVGKGSMDPTPTINMDELNEHFAEPPLLLSNTNKAACLNSLHNKSPPLHDDFNLSNITEHQVLTSLRSISSKAFGCDGLSRDMLMPIVDLLSPVITHIINYSITSGSFPSIWKHAHIIPLPKTSNPTSHSDFRPISILPVISKVLEQAVAKQLSDFLNTNQILSHYQSGFCPGHSTTTALLKVSDDVRLAMDNKMLTILVLLDFSSAFNSVDHDILLAILKSIGVSPSALSWFDSYLRGRKQRISTPDRCSEWVYTLVGVPQGGVLSPLLFAIFINEVTKFISSAYHLYADDLQIYRHFTIDNIELAIGSINNDLLNIEKWANTFGLLVNPSKSRALLIGSRQLRSKINFKSLTKVTYSGSMLEYSDKAKNLGVIFDCHFSWLPHINEVSKKLHHSLHALKRLQNFLPIPAKKLLAQSLLLPLFDYADVCYLDVTKELLRKLERLQNSCIRFIYGLRKFDHISEFRSKLQWLPIRLRRDMHVLILLFKILKLSSSPSYLFERFSYTAPSERPARSCHHRKVLDTPWYNTTFYENSFTVRAAQLWNALPEDIQQSPTVGTFKTRLKSHFMSTLNT